LLPYLEENCHKNQYREIKSLKTNFPSYDVTDNIDINFRWRFGKLFLEETRKTFPTSHNEADSESFIGKVFCGNVTQICISKL
jgi:hypothetical protein